LKEKGCQMAARKAASEIGEAPDPDNGPAQAAPVASLDRSATSKPAEPAPTAPPNRRSFVGAFAGLATALTAAAVGHHLDQTTPTDDTNGSAAVVGHVAPTGHTTTVNITAKGMKYHPSTITVPAGDQLVVEITNKDPNQVHDLQFANGAHSPRLAPGDHA
ncbi:cupredoxin domain-containing protein, partial [Cutibacterium acnes]|nr:cupredoxin domain-containing protein [Cutibacterium acnes]